MKCAKARRLLFDYLDGALDEKTSETIQTHLKRCERCTHALEEYRSYREKMAMLKDTHAPEGFLARVKDRVGTLDEKDAARGPKRIFTPGFKLPLELAGALAVILIAVVIFRHIQPGENGPSRSVFFEKRTEQTLKPSADEAKPVDKRKEDRAPAAVTVEDKSVQLDIQKESRRQIPETEMKEEVPSGGASAGAPPVEEEAVREELLMAEQPSFEADMEVGEPVQESDRRRDELRDSAPIETFAAVELTLAVPQPSETIGMKNAEKEELLAKKSVSAEAPQTAAKLQKGGRQPEVVENDILRLAEELGGMVISIDHRTGMEPQTVVSVRIPKSGYEDLLEGLSSLGVLESPVPEIPSGEEPALLVRITIPE
jgi:hypothetical protein